MLFKVLYEDEKQPVLFFVFVEDIEQNVVDVYLLQQKDATNLQH